MAHAQNVGMQSLIGVVNQLHDATTQLKDAFPGHSDIKLNFQLPQIAVVGSQSAGKSSVLENFVGRDFLPRGSGIVTRRPLVLQLIHHASAEYGEFLHLPGNKFINFEEIRAEIQRETDRLTGTNKGISKVPINLRVFSPNVLDLTLIDLPGMARVPVGDQPRDIEEQLRSMILQYIEQENCLILAVSAANVDLANSDALKLAKMVDPGGNRTIGVLTKLDLMDEGTNAKEILDNRQFPLRYGYIGVVNRSQRDIDSRKNIIAAIESERRFFLNHSVYKPLADRLGCAYLQKTLNAHLTRHIADVMPGLRSALTQQLFALERKITEYNAEFDFNDPQWHSKALVVYSLQFGSRYKEDIWGHCEMQPLHDKLSTGAEIRHLFHVRYPLALNAVEFTDESLMKREIAFTILNVVGVRVGIFTPDQAFDSIIRKQLNKMADPTVAVLDRVAEKLLSALEKCAEPLHRFPALANELVSLSRTFILMRVEETRSEIRALLQYENAYINARHEDFVGFSFNEQKPTTVRGLRKNPCSTVIHRGWLMICNVGLLQQKRHWFELTCDSLSWFRDDTLADRKYSIGVDQQLKFIDCDRGNRLILCYRSDGSRRQKNIFKDQPRLELMANTLEELEEWKMKLVNVGIFPMVDVESAGGNAASNALPDEIVSDPHLTWQVETIWVLVDSYLHIVRRTLQDLVPKAIVHSLVSKVLQYMQQRLVAELSQSNRCSELMSENANDRSKYVQLQNAYQCCKRALDMMSSISISKPPEFNDIPSWHLSSSSSSQNINNTISSGGFSKPSAVVPPRPSRPAPPPKVPGVPIRRDQSEPRLSSHQGGMHSMSAPSNDSNVRKPSAPSLQRGSATSANSNSSSQSVKKVVKTIDSSQRATFYAER